MQLDFHHGPLVSCHRDSLHNSVARCAAEKACQGSKLGTCDRGTTHSGVMPRWRLVLRIMVRPANRTAKAVRHNVVRCSLGEWHAPAISAKNRAASEQFFARPEERHAACEDRPDRSRDHQQWPVQRKQAAAARSLIRQSGPSRERADAKTRDSRADAASIEVNHRRRRAKTDRLGAVKPVSQLLLITAENGCGVWSGCRPWRIKLHNATMSPPGPPRSRSRSSRSTRSQFLARDKCRCW